SEPDCASIHPSFTVILVLSGLFIVSCIICIPLCVHCFRKLFFPKLIQKSTTSAEEVKGLLRSSAVPSYFSGFIRDITDEQLSTTRIIDFEEIIFEERISSGNYAVVFKGSWKGTPVAIKKINLNIGDEEFLREVKLLASLRHPNIVYLL